MAGENATPTAPPKDPSQGYYNDVMGATVIDEAQFMAAAVPPPDPPEQSTNVDPGSEPAKTTAPKDGGAAAGAEKPKGAAPSASAPNPFPDVEHAGFDGDRPIQGGPPAADAGGEQRTDAGQAQEDGQPAGKGRRASKADRYDAAIAGASKAEEETAAERRARLAAEAENEQLRRELAEARAGGPAAGTAGAAGGRPAGEATPPEGGAEATPPAEELKKPESDDFNTQAEFETALDQYYDKLHSQKAASKKAADEKAAATAAREDAQRRQLSADRAQWTVNAEKMREADDFKKVAEALGKLQSPWYSQQEFGQTLAPALDHFVRVSPVGGDVGLWLGRNPEQAAALAKLPGHPRQHHVHMLAWDRMARSMESPIPMLEWMASENGTKWFSNLQTAQTVVELESRIANVIGRLAAVTALRQDERGGGPAPTARTSQAPPPGTPPQGTSTGEMSSAVESMEHGDTDPDYDKVFRSRFAKRQRDAMAAAGPPAAVVPGRAQLGM